MARLPLKCGPRGGSEAKPGSAGSAARLQARDGGRVAAARDGARDRAPRACTYAVVVGAVLITINHGDAILAGDLPTGRWLRMGLTVLVPYLVSTFSSVGATLERGSCAPDARRYCTSPQRLERAQPSRDPSAPGAFDSSRISVWQRARNATIASRPRAARSRSIRRAVAFAPTDPSRPRRGPCRSPS